MTLESYLDYVHSWLSEVDPNTLSALEAAIIGGLLTGLFTIIGVSLTYFFQKRHSKNIENEKIYSLIKSLDLEITAIWNRYMKTMGKVIEEHKKGEPLLYEYPIISDYFTVYNSNAHTIGSIPDESLRNNIVLTFTRAKGFVDSWRHNTAMVQKTDTIKEGTKLDNHHVMLANYADQLIKSHVEIKQEISDLSIQINNFLNK